MNSKQIGTCENCMCLYCQECTDADEWMKFCSKQCENEYNKEDKK